MSIKGDFYAFNKSNVGTSPDKQGVYALYRDRVLTYIGKASNSIRSRLQDHLVGRDGQCTKASTQYKRELTSSPAAREKELLQEYVQQHGKLPLCNDVMP